MTCLAVCKTSDITDLSDSELDYWKDLILLRSCIIEIAKRLIEEKWMQAVGPASINMFTR